MPPAPKEKYVSDEDEYLLEDEHGRVKLVDHQFQKDLLVTGIILAVLGREKKTGEFEVEDYCFPGFPPAKPHHCLQRKHNSENSILDNNLRSTFLTPKFS